MRPLLRVAVACLAAAALGCSSSGEVRDVRAAPGSAAEAEADHNRILSEGYSQLYAAASSLRRLDEALIFKRESEATNRTLRELAEFSARLKAQLEAMAGAYPALSIRDDGLPLLERRTRESQNRDRVRSLAPIVGKGGVEFERTLLLSQSAAVNHLRYLARATAAAEKDDKRRAFLEHSAQELDGLYDGIVALLEQRYFCSAPG